MIYHDSANLCEHLYSSCSSRGGTNMKEFNLYAPTLKKGDYAGNTRRERIEI